MNVETLKQAGICLSYCRNAVFPQIPAVQDVLYVLQLSGEKDTHGNYCPEGAANWGEYIENTVLVAAAVASRVIGMERYDEAKARKIIAEAIIELCPTEAECLFVGAFVEAKRAAGHEVPPPKTNRETLLATCGCPECARTLREREQDFEPDDRHSDEPEDHPYA